MCFSFYRKCGAQNTCSDSCSTCNCVDNPASGYCHTDAVGDINESEMEYRMLNSIKPPETSFLGTIGIQLYQIGYLKLAGIEEGDLVIRINNIQFDSKENIHKLLTCDFIEEQLTILYKRNNERSSRVGFMKNPNYVNSNNSDNSSVKI